MKTNGTELANRQNSAIEPSAEDVEKVLANGDLSHLSPEQRVAFYRMRCAAAGLDPRARPFEFIVLKGKLKLYATKECTDQLNGIHGISHTIDSRGMVGDDLYECQVTATNNSGRKAPDVGVVPYFRNSPAEERANAIMKCVPLDAEILTRDGWKTYDLLSIGEEVLGYNAEIDETEWTSLEAINTPGLMNVGTLATTEGRFSVRCTSGHKWAVQNKEYQPDYRGGGTRGIRGPYINRRPDREIMTVENLVLVNGRKLILAAPERSEIESILSPQEAAILGWAVTDGTIKRVGNSVRIGICQSKEENFQAIRTLASGCRELVSNTSSRTFPGGTTCQTLPQHWWYFPAGFSRTILEKAGFRDRRDLPRITTRLSAPARQMMLQAFMTAEGTNKGLFCNTDQNIMDAFHILSALEGIAVGSIAPRMGIGATSPCFYQKLLKRRHIASNNLSFDSMSVESVWCPTTTLGTWIMRQGGRVMITGNSVTKAKRRSTLGLCGLGDVIDESELDTVSVTREATQAIPNPARTQLVEQLKAKLTPATIAKGDPATAPPAPAKSKGSDCGRYISEQVTQFNNAAAEISDDPQYRITIYQVANHLAKECAPPDAMKTDGKHDNDKVAALMKQLWKENSQDVQELVTEYLKAKLDEIPRPELVAADGEIDPSEAGDMEGVE